MHAKKSTYYVEFGQITNKATIVCLQKWLERVNKNVTLKKNLLHITISLILVMPQGHAGQNGV